MYFIIFFFVLTIYYKVKNYFTWYIKSVFPSTKNKNRTKITLEMWSYFRVTLGASRDIYRYMKNMFCFIESFKGAGIWIIYIITNSNWFSLYRLTYFSNDSHYIVLFYFSEEYQETDFDQETLWHTNVITIQTIYRYCATMHQIR